MEGRKRFRAKLAILMSVALIVCGLTVLPSEVKAADAVHGSWTTIGTNGWSYYCMGSGSSYTGGTSFNDPLVFTKGSYEGQSGNLKLRTPTVNVLGGHVYQVTLNAGTTRYCSTVQVKVYVNNQSVYSETKALETTGQQWTTSYAPNYDGTMYVEVNSGWTNNGIYTYSVSNSDTGETASVEPTTADPYPNTGTVGSVTTIGSNGWKYYIRGASSIKYGGGTSFSDTPRFKVVKSSFSGSDFYTTSPNYIFSAAGQYTITLNNLEYGDTSSSWLEVYSGSGTKLYETDNYGPITRGTTATYTIENKHFDAGDTIYLKYMQSFAAQGTKDISVSITPVSGSTTVEPTTSDGWTQVTPVQGGENSPAYSLTPTTVGVWNLYAKAGYGTMAYQGSGATFGDMKLRIDSVSSGSGLCAGSKYYLENGKTYNYTVRFTSTNVGAASILLYYTMGAPVVINSVTAGENVITGTFTCGYEGYNNFYFLPDASFPTGTIIDFEEMSVVEVPEETTTAEPTTEPVTSNDLGIKGYQITPYYNNESGRIGSRVIYEVNNTVNSRTPTEVGLVYALTGYETVNDNDVVVGSTLSTTINGSSHPLVYSYAATAAGNVTSNFTTQSGKNYYARTMSTTNSVSGFSATYYVRAYAKFSDNSYAYSKIYSFRAYDVADYLYQNHLLVSRDAHDIIYNTVLKAVTPSYAEVSYVWDKTMVDPVLKN